MLGDNTAFINIVGSQRSPVTSDGTYSVTVEATGFKKLQVSNVLMHVVSPVGLTSLTLKPAASRKQYPLRPLKPNR